MTFDVHFLSSFLPSKVSLKFSIKQVLELYGPSQEEISNLSQNQFQRPKNHVV